MCGHVTLPLQGTYARVWDVTSQCDGRFLVSGDFPFRGQYTVDVTTPTLETHALGSPFLVRVTSAACSSAATATLAVLMCTQVNVADLGLLVACASTSYATGHGLTVATAGA